tara:strand:- start:800 stop:1765 length:966 start_codon:yes stop_codon:yes gene_type:complete
MISFIKRVIIFLVIFIFIILSLFFYLSDKKINVVDKKILFFNAFLKKHEKVNLIIGSSLARQTFNPTIFGLNWFAFCNASQHINDSKLFLKSIAHNKNIDTLIVTINPFDFSNVSPLINGQERINQLFDDSTLTDNNYEVKKVQFQKILNKYFFKPDLIIRRLIPNNDKSANAVEMNILLANGYKDRKWRVTNLDKLKKNKINITTSSPADIFYKNIPDGLNKIYFDNFIKQARKITSNIIFIITPKSKYYNEYVKKEYELVHLQLIKYFQSSGYSFFDFSSLLDTNSAYFNDNVHLSNDGINHFSKIVKKMLKEDSTLIR